MNLKAGMTKMQEKIRQNVGKTKVIAERDVRDGKDQTFTVLTTLVVSF